MRVSVHFVKVETGSREIQSVGRELSRGRSCAVVVFVPSRKTRKTLRQSCDYRIVCVNFFLFIFLTYCVIVFFCEWWRLYFGGKN